MMRNNHFIKVILIAICLLWHMDLRAERELITNIYDRQITSLNGEWSYIIDPYETGFYNYRYSEREEEDREAYWSSDVPRDKSDRLEHGYNEKYTLNVPGDWNSQDRVFLYYEGSVWYKRSFDYVKSDPANRLFLHFGAVNYQADVYLNGKKLGRHKGGFTPFQFEIAASLLKEKDNYLVVKVDNKRHKEEAPTLNTDWWNYGGITRDVLLVETPSTFIEDYSISLKKGEKGSLPTTKKAVVEGWVKLNGVNPGENIVIEIPELKIKKKFQVTGATTLISFNISRFQLWSDKNPKLYNVTVSSTNDKVEDQIGFRTIEVVGKNILLNGEPVFLRGICTHEEIAREGRRAHSKDDALYLLGLAKSLNANFVRLAHYPHNEHMVRAADSLGLLIWSEIPVYWTIDFTSDEVFEKAKGQLWEMIARDRNRASVIIWSVGNETPVSPIRTKFMSGLVEAARQMDPTRPISAALEVHNVDGVNVIDDPLGEYTDIVAVNEYLGWYGGSPASCSAAQWKVKYDKPLFFSETGAGALSGFHADSLTRWSEEYQEWYFKEQVAMMKRMPDNYVGLSPWILVDFRSPRRNHPDYQEGWNRKGLIGEKGQKKKAFYILQEYYAEMQKEFQKAGKLD